MQYWIMRVSIAVEHIKNETNMRRMLKTTQLWTGSFLNGFPRRMNLFNILSVYVDWLKCKISTGALIWIAFNLAILVFVIIKVKLCYCFASFVCLNAQTFL